MKETHVASIRLYVASEDIDSVAGYIKSIKFADLVQLDRRNGRLTVVLETDNLSDITRSMGRFDQLEGVANVFMVFHSVITRQDAA